MYLALQYGTSYASEEWTPEPQQFPSATLLISSECRDPIQDGRSLQKYFQSKTKLQMLFPGSQSPQKHFPFPCWDMLNVRKKSFLGRPSVISPPPSSSQSW